MEIRTWLMVQRAIRKAAIEQGRSSAEIRAQIRRTIYIGMHSSDPAVCRAWRAVSSSGGVPTPEKAIVYWTERRMLAYSQKE